MRYFIDVSEWQAAEINKLIKIGKYQNIAQFISAAIENQIYLENSVGLSQQDFLNKKDSDIYINLAKTINTENTELKRITLGEINSQPKTVSMPSFSILSASLFNIAEDKSWLWGQTNRILPIKIGLRVLYSMIDSEQWIDLERFRDKAAHVATLFGTKIRKYEDALGKIRSDRISAGLPKEGEVKSINRYKSHFLAYMRKDEKLDGAMTFLRFVNLNKDEKGKILIGLTDGGLNFAKLDSPVMDHNDFEKSFFQTEINFYLDHVLKNVKGESSAIKWLLTKLVNGMVTRDEIIDELRKDFSQTWQYNSKKFSDKVLNTQRAGLIARMFELGLIRKEKDGIEVKYIISPLGESYFKNN